MDNYNTHLVSRVKIRFRPRGLIADKDKDILETVTRHIVATFFSPEDLEDKKWSDLYRRARTKSYGTCYVVERGFTTYVIRRDDKFKWYVLDMRGSKEDKLNMIVVVAYMCALQVMCPKWEIPFIKKIIDCITTQ